MTVTSGFFNGIDRAANATDISAIFDGLISDGIYDTIGEAFAVTAGGGNFLNLGTGRAWFNHTWIRNDATVVYEAPASELLLKRYDCMVLEVDHSDPVRDDRIFILSGTPSSNPVLPELATGPLKFQYLLASVLRNANSTEILATDITPYQGTAQTPFVNGLIEKFDIQTILTQYQERSLLLLDNLEQQLLVLQETGVPIHHNTHAIGASDALPPGSIGAASLTNGKVTPSEASSAIAVYNSGNHTLVFSDNCKLLLEMYSGATVVTVPKNVFPIGAEIEICRYWGAGAVSVAPAADVNIFSLDYLRSISGVYGVIALKQVEANVWLLAGALA